MTESSTGSPVVVVTGANGLVGGRTCAALAAARRHRAGRGPPGGHRAGPARRRGVGRRVLRPGGGRPGRRRRGRRRDHGAPDGQRPGDAAPGRAWRARRCWPGPRGTPASPRLVHVSTGRACTTGRRAWATSTRTRALVGDDADDYAVTKRDTDAALAEVDGLTRVLVRPPAILGAGETSVWNPLRPAAMRDDERARHAVPRADVRLGARRRPGRAPRRRRRRARSPTAEDAARRGRSPGGCTVVNAAGGPATLRDYVGTVTPPWASSRSGRTRPAWTGQILAGRAARLGLAPRGSTSAQALAEIDAGLRS